MQRQRHFGILTYTVNDRFKKMMIILVIILVLLAAIVITLLVVLLHHRGSEDTSTTTKIALNSIPTTKIPVTTQNSNPNSKGTTANPEKTTVTSEPAVKTPYPAPPTDPVETTAPPAPDIPRCAPSPPPNPPYLFAYSNDLSPNVVSLTADTFFDALDKDGSSYATVRFDTSPEDPVYFAPDTSSVHSIVNGRLPNPALSFKTTAIGSDIIKTIERYYTSAVQHGFSTCGAIIVILLKRLPTETDISDIVAKIRANSGLVLVLTSTSPSGGDQPKTAYRIASKTNGMGIFVDDAKLRQHIDRAPIFGVRPIYCANVQVSDLDFYQLPNFNVPRNVPRLNRVSFTVQDHGPIDSFQRLELKFSDITNATLVTKIAVEAEDVRKLGSTGYSTWLGFVAGDEYRTEIDCDYTSDDIEELQIRVQTYE
ncbi:Protein CBG24710 [Caenorhabditis briggsae]|uniref:Protein CBG24710 n=1 Tax=Caenorhabditis briggsae TaxID=6238 RepID=A8WLA8_CAEBR|nr:Protein CBG24710 [Caenorhabditis briggsae]CAP21253.2 Protein CBG24710 [Caenorhabditis briggsae]